MRIDTWGNGIIVGMLASGAVCLVVIFIALIIGIFIPRPTIILHKHEWECTQTGRKLVGLPMLVGKTTVIMPTYIQDCVQYSKANK